MGRPLRPWFRFYTEAFGDPKIRRLTPAQRWTWVAVLGAARVSPVEGLLMRTVDKPLSTQELADFAGQDRDEIATALRRFRDEGLIERLRVPGHPRASCWRVTRWEERQAERDRSAGQRYRVRAYSRSQEASLYTETVYKRDEFLHSLRDVSTRKSGASKSKRDLYPHPQGVTPSRAHARGDDDETKNPQDDLIDQALALIVERRAAGRELRNPAAWRRAVAADLLATHGERARSLVAQGITSPRGLANLLEPTGVRQGLTDERPDCVRCHGVGVIPSEDGTTAERCPVCVVRIGTGMPFSGPETSELIGDTTPPVSEAQGGV